MIILFVSIITGVALGYARFHFRRRIRNERNEVEPPFRQESLSAKKLKSATPELIRLPKFG